MRGKSGLEWPVGRLMATILAVVLLIIIVLGWSGAIKPLSSQIGSRFNDVFLFYYNWRSDGDVPDCVFDKMSEFKGGSELVSILGVDRDIEICRDYCYVRLGEGNEVWFIGSTPNRFRYDGKRDVLAGGRDESDKWYSLNENYLGLDVDMVEFYREIYSVLNETICDSVSDGVGCDLEKFESVMEFNSGNIPEVRVELSGLDSIYHWEDGKWSGMTGKNEVGFPSEIKFIKNLYDNYYSEGKKVLIWDRIEGDGVEIERGMSYANFGSLVHRLVTNWNSRVAEYEKWEEKIKSKKIILRGKEYGLEILKYELKGSVHTIPIISVDLGYDKVGVYYNERLHFYSEKDNDEYDYLVFFSDEEWDGLSKINKIYEFFKDIC
jgi:hypothetical protein